MAIKKVLQDKRYKNRELQIMRLVDHPNVVALRHFFFSTSTDTQELYLNLVLEYVPETVYRVAQHYHRLNQRIPLLFVKLYTYQMCRSLAYIHNAVGVCHRDIKPQNLLVGASFIICLLAYLPATHISLISHASNKKKRKRKDNAKDCTVCVCLLSCCCR